MSVKAILGAGNPLLDISVDVDNAFLEKYQLQVGHSTLAEEKDKPIYDEIVKLEAVQYIAGGATQNAIRGAQWMLGKDRKVTHFIGSVGDDENAQKLKSAAEADGVQTHYFVSKTGKPTGRAAVLISGKERTIIADLAAANDYQHDHVKSEEITKVVESVGIVYSACFFLTVSPETSLYLGKHCLEHNKIFAINLSAPFLIQFFWDPLSKILPYADYIFCNETEAGTFAEKQGWDKSDLKSACEKLANWPKENSKRQRVVVFTQGKNPALIFIDGGVKEYPVKPIDPSLIVDTNGAGDSWVGGFLAGLAQDKPLDECVRAANHCAHTIIQRSGCVYPADNDFVWQ